MPHFQESNQIDRTGSVTEQLLGGRLSILDAATPNTRDSVDYHPRVFPLSYNAERNPANLLDTQPRRVVVGRIRQPISGEATENIPGFPKVGIDFTPSPGPKGGTADDATAAPESKRPTAIDTRAPSHPTETLYGQRLAPLLEAKPAAREIKPAPQVAPILEGTNPALRQIKPIPPVNPVVEGTKAAEVRPADNLSQSLYGHRLPPLQEIRRQPPAPTILDQAYTPRQLYGDHAPVLGLRKAPPPIMPDDAATEVRPRAIPPTPNLDGRRYPPGYFDPVPETPIARPPAQFVAPQYYAPQRMPAPPRAGYPYSVNPEAPYGNRAPIAPDRIPHRMPYGASPEMYGRPGFANPRAVPRGEYAPEVAPRYEQPQMRSVEPQAEAPGSRMSRAQWDVYAKAISPRYSGNLRPLPPALEAEVARLGFRQDIENLTKPERALVGAAVAYQLGLPVDWLVTVGIVENNLTNTPGDYSTRFRVNTSFGVTQLHARGELTFDAEQNRVDLRPDEANMLAVAYGRSGSHVANWYVRHPSMPMPRLLKLAQGPSDHRYENKVANAHAEARRLVQQSGFYQYFTGSRDAQQ